MTAQAIGKYERGEDIPSSKVLSALAKTLKVSISYCSTRKVSCYPESSSG